MKKITAFTIAAIMALGMTACGDTEKKSAGAQQDAKAAAQGENGGSKTSREDMLKTANGNAKTAYNMVAEYLADLETEGRLSEATEQEAAKFAVEELSSSTSGGIVGVKLVDIDTDSPYFCVLWRESNSTDIIGRYPDAASSPDEHIEWDVGAEREYIGEHSDNDADTLTDVVSNSKLKTANGNAKTAYNAVAEYLADMETMGKLSEVTEQSAADEAADMLGGHDMGGMIGVTITDLENARFEVFWRESEDSNIVGRYPDAPRSVEDCPEWDVGAYSYIK